MAQSYRPAGITRFVINAGTNLTLSGLIDGSAGAGFQTFGPGWFGISGTSNVTLLDQKSTAIKQGDAMNHIELSCVGNTMTLTINGVQVGQVQDGAYATGRHFIGVGGTGPAGAVPLCNLASGAPLRQPVALRDGQRNVTASPTTGKAGTGSKVDTVSIHRGRIQSQAMLINAAIGEISGAGAAWNAVCPIASSSPSLIERGNPLGIRKGQRRTESENGRGCHESVLHKDRSD